MNHVNGRICLLFAVGVIASLGLPERAFAQAGQGLIGNSLGEYKPLAGNARLAVVDCSRLDAGFHCCV